MKATELRIGNWVYSNFTESNIQISAILASATPDVQPIPITEEWLESFGFEHDSFGWYKKKIGTWTELSIGFKEYPHVDLCDTTVINDHDFDRAKILNHVHQLQNLYHALTGEELLLK